MQAGDFFTEVTSKYYGPLGVQHVQEMWGEGGIIPPHTLSVLSFSEAETRDLQLCLVRAVNIKEGLSQNGSDLL
jgi:hypothetical protein